MLIIKGSTSSVNVSSVRRAQNRLGMKYKDMFRWLGKRFGFAYCIVLLVRRRHFDSLEITLLLKLSTRRPAPFS